MLLFFIIYYCIPRSQPDPCHQLHDCDFSMGFCAWTQRAEGNAAWHIAGQAPAGPKFDHTANSEAGWFLLAAFLQYNHVPSLFI